MTASHTPRLGLSLLFLSSLLACLSGPPTQQSIQKQLTKHHPEFADLCNSFPALGVHTIGVEQGRVVLGYGQTFLFSGPTDADLALAHLDRASYDATVKRLLAIDILQIQTGEGSDPGVDFIVDMSGISVSGSTTWIHCGATPPAPPSDPSAASSSDGRACDPLEAGWWLCMEWT